MHSDAASQGGGWWQGDGAAYDLRDGGLPLARGAEDLRLRFHPRVRERHPPRHAGQHLSTRSRDGSVRAWRGARREISRGALRIAAHHDVVLEDEGGLLARERREPHGAVSYTHLTLPTILLV